MTSTIYSNTLKQSRSILKWSLKNNTAIMIVEFCVLSVLLPVIAIFSRVINVGLLTEPLNMDPFENSMGATISGLYISVYGFAAVLFSIIIAAKAFSYMQNKRSVDMFGSLPVNRRTMFFSKYIGAIISTLIPIILTTVITMFCVLPSAELVRQLSVALLCFSIGIIANISLIGLISLCCGTTFDTIISTLIINGSYPVIVFLCVLLPSRIIPGLSNIQLNSFMFTALCPLSAPFDIYANAISNGYTFKTTYILYWTAFIAVCIIASYLICKKRKAESAQSGFAFLLPQIIIRLFANFGVGIAFGTIFAVIARDSSNNVADQYIWFWIGMVACGFVTNLVLQLLYHKGFKGFGKSLIWFGSMIVISAVMFAFVVTGWFGTDVYVPAKESIKSVALYTGDNDNDRAQISDKEVIDLVVDAHKQITSDIREIQYPYSLGQNANYRSYASDTDEFSDYSSSSEHKTYDNVSIEYILNNGSKVKRFYSFYPLDPDDLSILSNKIRDVIDNEIYIFRNTIFPNLKSNDYILNMDIYDHLTQLGSNIIQPDDDKDEINNLIQAMKYDFENNYKEVSANKDKYQKLYTVNLSFDFGSKTFTTGRGSSFGMLLGASIVNSSPSNNSLDFDVYSNYTRTLKQLEKMGYTNFDFLEEAQRWAVEDKDVNSACTFKDNGYVYVMVSKDFAYNNNVYCRFYDTNQEPFFEFGSAYEKGEHIGNGVYKFPLQEINFNGDDIDFQYAKFYSFDENNKSKCNFTVYEEIKKNKMFVIKNQKVANLYEGDWKNIQA